MTTYVTTDHTFTTDHGLYPDAARGEWDVSIAASYHTEAGSWVVQFFDDGTLSPVLTLDGVNEWALEQALTKRLSFHARVSVRTVLISPEGRVTGSTIEWVPTHPLEGLAYVTRRSAQRQADAWSALTKRPVTVGERTGGRYPLVFADE